MRPPILCLTPFRILLTLLTLTIIKCTSSQHLSNGLRNKLKATANTSVSGRIKHETSPLPRQKRLLERGEVKEICRPKELIACFVSAIAEIGPLNREGPIECQRYATFLYCFDHSDCSQPLIATIAAETFKRHTGNLAPKESFIALYGAVTEHCQHACNNGGHDWSCRALMPAHMQDQDQAIYMELSGQARQIRLGVQNEYYGCKRFQTTLQRWLEFRAPVCPHLLRCSCDTDETLRHCLLSCGVDCQKLTKRIRYRKSSSAARRRSSYSIRINYSFHLLIILFLCIIVVNVALL